MKNYKLTIQYDGSEFYGFQVQRKLDVPTVQKVLEDVCFDIYKQHIRITPSGRTDRGVHARAQVINFRAPEVMPLENLKMVLNVKTPSSIKINKIEEVDYTFNARKLAIDKTYKYLIDLSSESDVFERQYVWQLCKKLDIEKMDKAANILQGKHDFIVFAKNASAYKTCVREIYDISAKKSGNKCVISVTGSGFLRGMVRNIVALLVLVGLGERSVSDVKKILKSQDRDSIGRSAPACGLYLDNVKYQS